MGYGGVKDCAAILGYSENNNKLKTLFSLQYLGERQKEGWDMILTNTYESPKHSPGFVSQRHRIISSGMRPCASTGAAAKA